jgi:molybdate transport system substrate-binding protein
MLKKSFLMLVVPLLFVAARVDGAQLKLLVGGAMAEPVKKVGADFSRKAGDQLDFTTDTTGALQNRLRSGEKADLIVVTAAGMDALEKENLIVPGTRVVLARGLIAVGVRAGAASPDLSSLEGFKKAILAARSVSFVDPKAGGTSGTYMAGLFQRMGIGDEVQKKTVFRNQGSEVADAVSKGEAEIGITFVSELLPNKGVKVAGPLPNAIQNPTDYVAAIPVGAANPGAARTFLQELRSPAGQRAVKEAGLEPAQRR